MVLDSLKAFWDWALAHPSDLRDISAVVLGIIGLILLVWRSVNLSHQTKSAQQQVLTMQEQLRSTQKQLSLSDKDSSNNRFQNAYQMMASKDIFVRIGGISAFRRLADIYPEQYNYLTGELLCAYVRSRPHVDSDGVRLTDDVEDDIQKAIDCIGALQDEEMRGNARFRIDLHGAYLLGANLGQMNLCDANLREAQLERAVLPHILRGADLSRSKLGSADLDTADLSRAILDEANLEGSNLRSTTLIGASAQGANFRYAELLNVNLSKCDLRAADLYDAKISGDLSDCRLENADLTGAIIGPADLTNARFGEADLSGAVLCRRHQYIDANEVYSDLTSLEPKLTITQDQLDLAKKDLKIPPIIYEDVVDDATGCKLTWNGGP